MPNWGGSAQLFGNGSRLDHADPVTQNEPQAEGSSSQIAPVEATSQPSPTAEHTPQGTPPSHSDEDEGSGIDSKEKGKARAVTVEEVEDEENVKD
jgi:E3 ubiquitin-protein ligase synoviolin